MTNADIDALSAEDFYIQFRSIWKGKEVPLTEDVSMFTRGKGKITLFVISGIHGEERSGPISLFNWAKKIADRKIKGKVVVVPLMNPTAWNMRRRAVGNKNLNFVWNEKRAPKFPQVKKVMRLLEKEKAVIFLDLHEDSSAEDGLHYICRHLTSRWGLQFQKDVGVSPRRGIWKKHDYQTAESFAHALGIEKSFTVETSPYHHIDDRADFHLSAIEYCFKFANNKENW